MSADTRSGSGRASTGLARQRSQIRSRWPFRWCLLVAIGWIVWVIGRNTSDQPRRTAISPRDSSSCGRRRASRSTRRSSATVRLRATAGRCWSDSSTRCSWQGSGSSAPPSWASSSASCGCRAIGWSPRSRPTYIEILRNIPLLLQIFVLVRDGAEAAAGAGAGAAARAALAGRRLRRHGRRAGRRRLAAARPLSSHPIGGLARRRDAAPVLRRLDGERGDQRARPVDDQFRAARHFSFQSRHHVSAAGPG